MGSQTSASGSEPAGEAKLLLSLRGVSIAPPGSARVLLQGVELDLARGECVALVGPSGAGKTTLLRTINGQVPPAAGRVIVDGHDLSALKREPLRRLRARIGFVAQQHDLVEPLRVHTNVMAGALGRWSNLRAARYLVHPRPDELEECRSALDSVGLAHKLREPTSALSGGEQQRVAIARALVQAPLLLLADEPVASLDPATAREVLALLTQLAKARGMALICSLHQPELAERYFTRTLEVRGGGLAEAAANPERAAERLQVA